MGSTKNKPISLCQARTTLQRRFPRRAICVSSSLWYHSHRDKRGGNRKTTFSITVFEKEPSTLIALQEEGHDLPALLKKVSLLIRHQSNPSGDKDQEAVVE